MRVYLDLLLWITNLTEKALIKAGDRLLHLHELGKLFTLCLFDDE